MSGYQAYGLTIEAMENDRKFLLQNQKELNAAPIKDTNKR